MWMYGFLFASYAAFGATEGAWAGGAADTLRLGGWELHDTSGVWRGVEVPGTVHQQLGLEPFRGNRETESAWVDERSWEYRCRWEVDPSRHAQWDLVFHGLDTYAVVLLNGQRILRADNAHRTWRVKGVELEAVNELRVVMRPTVAVGQAELEALKSPVPLSNEPRPAGRQTSGVTRKPQFQFGWDWGPRLVGAGITGPVELVGRDGPVLAGVAFELLDGPQAAEGIARYRCTAEVDGADGRPLTVHWTAGSGAPCTATGTGDRLEATCTWYDVERWWPAGAGSPELTPVTTHLLHGTDTLDRRTDRIGIRTLALHTAADSTGAAFTFEVNGQPVFLRGANVVPPDFFLPRGDRGGAADRAWVELVEQATAAGFNALRVWGGGTYPPDAFFDACDAAGVLVWQDFPYACTMVPADRAWRENALAEAREHVLRLRNRPSLALWCGNNESLTGWTRWGWADGLSRRDSVRIWKAYDRHFHRDLPALVAEAGCGTPYWPSSPSAGPSLPETLSAGDQHAWHVWFDTLDFASYAQRSGRFVSEYGLQSLPGRAALAAMDSALLAADWRGPDGEVLRSRQRSRMPWIAPDFDGWDMLDVYTRRWTGREATALPLDLAVYASQITQAEALRAALTGHRRRAPHTMGSLFWQLNDVWPAVSWSTIDASGTWKLAHYAASEATRPLALSLHDDASRLTATLLGNGPSALADGRGTTLELVITAWHVDGSFLGRRALPAGPAAAARRAWTTVLWSDLPSSAFPALDTLPPTHYVLRFDLNEVNPDRSKLRLAEAGWSPLPPGDMAWTSSALSLTAEPAPDGSTRLAIRSLTPTAGVGLFSDLPGRFTENARWVWPDRTWTPSFLPSDPTRPATSEHFRVYSVSGLE